VLVTLDFETELIAPGLQAPPPVCASTARETPEGPHGVVCPTTELKDLIHRLLTEATIVGHNIAGFDAPVMLAWLDCTDLLFKAFDESRILDTMLVERIAEIGCFTTRKKLTFDNLCRAHGVRLPNKDPVVRLSYGPLRNRPLSEYSEAQILYSLEDATLLLELWQRQKERWIDRGKVRLADVAFLTKKMFAHNLTRAWGLRTDPERTDDLRREAHAHVEALREAALDTGFVERIKPHWSLPADHERYQEFKTFHARWRKGQTSPEEQASWAEQGAKFVEFKKNMSAIRAVVTEAYEGNPPMTKPQRGVDPERHKAQVATSAAVLLESGDPRLEAFENYGSWSTVLNKDMPILLAGHEDPIHSKFGVADTLRVTSSKPNTMNFKRDAPGDTTHTSTRGIRECFIPRVGYCYVAIDHSMLELCTLAQVIVWCLRRWDLADRLNAGVDPHSHLGAEIVGVPYDTFLAHKKEGEYKNARDCAKPVNFGCPGGMQAKTMTFYAKQSYRIVRPFEFWRDLILLWQQMNPDSVEYLRWIRTLKHGDRYDSQIPGTGVHRRGMTYCTAANTHFQGLGAVLEGHIAYEVAREQFTGYTRVGKHSPLSEARPCNFAHDEHFLEAPVGLHTDVADRMTEIMTEYAKPYLPDVAIRSEVVCMARWSKKAHSERTPSGYTIWDDA